MVTFVRTSATFARCELWKFPSIVCPRPAEDPCECCESAGACFRQVGIFHPHAEDNCEKLNAGGSHRPPSKSPDGESSPEPPPAYSEVHPAEWKEIRKYKARKVNEARPRKIISRPFGLPKHINIEQYYSNPICMRGSYNYKVEVAVDAKTTELKQYLSVADKCTGPDLIRADCVPPEILANVSRDCSITW